MSAPDTRTVCQLTGEVSRPSALFAALAAADAHLDDVEVLRARVVEFKRRADELAVELEELRGEFGEVCAHRHELLVENHRLRTELAAARGERDDLRACVFGGAR